MRNRATQLPAASRRPARSRETTRKAILDAAAREFAKAGLAGARTDAIAMEARVNKAMLYYYFKSKQRLYEAVVEEFFAEFNRQALKVLAGHGPAQEVLLRYVNLHFDFICNHRKHAALYQQLMMTGGKPLERLVKRHFVPRSEAFSALLVRGMRDGEFRKAEVRHTALSIVALIVFYFSAAPVLELLGQKDVFSPADLAARKRAVLEFIRHGLFMDGKAKSK